MDAFGSEDNESGRVGGGEGGEVGFFPGASIVSKTLNVCTKYVA